MRALFQHTIATAALLAALSAPLSFAQNAQTAQSLAPRADPLLSVDLNRNEIVGRLMTQWQADIAANQRDSFKQKLAGLRADRLLAVSLVGSFDGVLQVLYGQEKADQAAVARNTLSGLGTTRDSQKALGDANIDLVYTPLTPCRLFDTRTGQSSALGQLGGAFAPNTGRNIVPAGACAVPASGVKSLFVALTTLNNTPNSGGYITVLAPAAPLTTTTDIFNFASQWSASNTIVATGTAGQFVVYVAAANAEVVVDVLGYFAPPPQPIGDITEVNTGAATTTGLTGGTTSGIATLSLAPGFKLPQSCATGQIPSYNSGTGLWSCNTPTSGTVTSINAGAGLTGGPISTTGTINLTANQLLPTAACATNQIAKWNGSAWICAADDAGPANAFVQGGNAFGAPGVLGTNDAQPLTVKTGGTDVKVVNARGDGMRVTYATNAPNTINGHFGNAALVNVRGATIGGGGGDGSDKNQVTGTHGTVAGGVANEAGFGSVVSGGAFNAVSAGYAVISGGYGNTVLGGDYGVVAGGQSNLVSGTESTVAGGNGNTASGYRSAVVGGFGNFASGDYSFAAGVTARADKNGSFVWADNTLGAPYFAASKNWASPAGANTFNVRATGGVQFATSVNSGSGVPTTYCYMGPSGTGWICASDRNVKERVEPITPSRVLAGVLAMPVSTWSIIGSKVRQMGPMAQDFYRAFGLGDTDKAINSIDVGGVAFAAIQGLNQVVQKKDAEIAALKKRLAAIEKRLGIQ